MAFDNIYVVGDTHGGLNDYYLRSKVWVEQKELTNKDILIQLGDFGYFWQPKMSKEESFKLTTFANKKYQVSFLDGNHENFDRLHLLPTMKQWGGHMGVLRIGDGEVYHLRRGEVFNFNGIKIFIMGGAQSIDRGNRLEGISWWKEELHTHKEIDNALENLEKVNFEVDYILTHTCPTPIIQKLAVNFKGYYVDPERYQDPCSTFFDHLLLEKKIKFKEWHFGHFHVNETIEYQDKIFRCHYDAKPHKLGEYDAM